MVRWATVDHQALNAERVRVDVDAYIDTHPDAERVRAEFNAAATD